MPSVGIMDSQMVKTTESGGERGYDGGKKINGRKRHIMVDTLGFCERCCDRSTRKSLWFCRNAGSSSVPSRGSTNTDETRKTTNETPKTASPWYISL